ncbi:MAG: ABC transporter ATP-binding protein [Eubacteriales bacterium]
MWIEGERGRKMGFLKKYAKRYMWQFFTCVFFLSAEAFCDLLQPTIMEKIVDVGIFTKDINLVLRLGEQMLLITALGACFAVARNFISSIVSQKFGASLRSDLYKKIMNLSFDRIDEYDPASLVTRLTNDVTQVQNFVNGMMRVFVKAPLLCIGSIVMAAFLNIKMSVILLCIVPVILLLIVINTRLGFPVFLRVQTVIDKVNGVMREYLSGVRVVKAFNRAEFEEERFSGVNEELTSVQTRSMRIMAIFSPGISLTVNLGIAAVIWFGGNLVNSGLAHVGMVIAFVNYLGQLLMSLMLISMVFTNFVRSKASLGRIGEVMNVRSSIVLPLHPLSPSGNDITFDDVCFSYIGTAPVLKNIKLSCHAGETIGIIGTTGSGKTTLINLIPRLYDVTSGKLLIGNSDIKEIDDKKLRDSISVVSQQTVLFSGTIAENILWGKKDAAPIEVRAAAAAAQADAFISGFPQGYKTILGQGGVNLSGGQKQRIAIARALVRNPRILILDDCTSAVDVITEAKIQKALRSYSDNLICIIISQRISSVISADRIAVMDNGAIVGTGTHDELIKSCPIYRDIYISQYGQDGRAAYAAE